MNRIHWLMALRCKTCLNYFGKANFYKDEFVYFPGY